MPPSPVLLVDASRASWRTFAGYLLDLSVRDAERAPFTFVRLSARHAAQASRVVRDLGLSERVALLAEHDPLPADCAAAPTLVLSGALRRDMLARLRSTLGARLRPSARRWQSEGEAIA